MGEQDKLTKIDATGEWIWGDDAEKVVFAQVYGDNLTLIFRFTHHGNEDENNDNLPSRIVNCFHGRSTGNDENAFSSRAAMRNALWDAIADTWPHCTTAPDVGGTDIIIDMGVDGSWSFCHEPLFSEYLRTLTPLNNLAGSLNSIEVTVNFSDLVRKQHLGGRGCTTLVHHVDDPIHKFVFKGIDFRSFLFMHESRLVEDEVRIFLHATQLVGSQMPRHPNIIAPPPMLVTISKPTTATKESNGMLSDSQETAICGTLYPFYENGSLGDKIDQANKAEVRLPLALKARWCYQMASAVEHTHLVAHTFHMDIKPGNFVLDKDLNLLLVDWEQSDAAVSTAAPEIDGTWDAAESDDGSTVEYTKYRGPARRNMPETTPGDHGWNVWNPFLIWEDACPKASELAEVFSLGRSMWILLSQYGRDKLEDIESTEDVAGCWEHCNDIPQHWQDIVTRCMSRKPNERPGIHEVSEFWKTELEKTPTFWNKELLDRLLHSG